MPMLLNALSVIGTAAMLWVGGGIVIHALEVFGWEAPAHLLHDVAAHVGHAVPMGGGAVEWLVSAVVSAIAGLAIGAVIVAVLKAVPRRKAAAASH